MDEREIVSQLRAQLPAAFGTLHDDEAEDLIAIVKGALEFAKFLATVTDANAVRPGAQDLAKRISEGLKAFHAARGIGGVAGRFVTASPLTAYEELERINADIAEHGAILSRLSELMAADAIPFPLTWRTYPSVLELKAEYAVHMAILCDVDATAADRAKALLETTRLQIVFLSNTFC